MGKERKKGSEEPKWEGRSDKKEAWKEGRMEEGERRELRVK